MPAELVDHAGVTPVSIDPATVAELRSRSEFFWLDLVRPESAEIERIGEAFGFHPLAVEDATQFDKRPRLDVHESYAFLVLYGAPADGEAALVEVHAFFSERYLITVRREDSGAFGALRRRIAERRYDLDHPIAVLYHLADELIDSFFPLLDRVDDRIDALGDGIMERPTDAQLHEMFELKRHLVQLRRVLAPERDVFSSLAAGVATLPGMTEGAERYFRDLYDRLIRLADAIDSYRDLLTSTMDVYLSTVSNRLNQVVKKLTVIATIFLPVTFVTGFFGQNFGWLVQSIGGLGNFLAFGVGLEVASIAALLTFMWRRGWF